MAGTPRFRPTTTRRRLRDRFPSLGGPAGGRCEVVCFTADHEASFADLDVDRVALVIEAWTDRTAELASMPGVAQVYPFENRVRRSA